MSFLINKSTNFITQGMTGATGTFRTEQALAYGARMACRFAHHVDNGGSLCT
jgi:succinyl-CoA synthetase alpha subunit